MIENLRTMTDDEVINFINKIVTDNEDLELKDLKSLLAETSGRKLEKKYINIIAERIKSKIQPEPVVDKRKYDTAPKDETPKEEPKEEKKKIKPTFDDIYNVEDYEDMEERYPVMMFLIGLFKVFAWIFLIGTVVVAALLSFFIFSQNIITVCGIMFGSIILAIFLLVYFYYLSEKIKIKIDIETHLRKILNK